MSLTLNIVIKNCLWKRLTFENMAKGFWYSHELVFEGYPYRVKYRKSVMDTQLMNSCVHSHRWERREAGGDATRPQPGMKGGVGDILPTLPQSRRRPPSPRPRRTADPKTTPRKRQRRREPEAGPRGRRRSLARRKTPRRRSEGSAPAGVGVDWMEEAKSQSGRRSSPLGVRSFHRPGPLLRVPAERPSLFWRHLNFFFFLSVHFILKPTDARKEERKEERKRARISAPESS